MQVDVGEAGELALEEQVDLAGRAVALFLDHQGSAEEVLKWADDAMYVAKQQGGNQVRLHAAAGSAAPA